MTRHHGDIPFTDAVSSVQNSYGSGAFFARQRSERRPSHDPDRLTDDETEFLTERDRFFLSTASETGWPYVQFRGGPTGFLQILDEHRIGWADFRGNLQYISTGNLTRSDWAAIIAVDWVHQRRLKLFGHATVFTAEQDPELVSRLQVPGYDAVVERGVVVTVEAFDWNCPQHITPRWTADELQRRLKPLQAELARLRDENADLRRRLT